MPRPDFPETLPAFAARFGTEDACFRYIIDSRWPDGFRCAGCGSTEAYERTDRRALQCKRCDKVHSATAGTVMHGSRQPLCSWLWAAYLVITSKRGISAVEVQNQLGIRRYEVSFNMLHKLRAAMVSPDRTPLAGQVEVDETYLGGPERGGQGKGGKAVIVGAVEVRESGAGRLRLRLVPSANRGPLFKFIKDNVQPGSTVITDAAQVYQTLHWEGYGHELQSTASGDPQDAVLPHLHIAFSNLKTWLLGTHHGRVSRKHLQAYLNEFVFRFNRRGNLYAAFQTLLGLSAKVKGPTYEGLYEGTFQHANPAHNR